MSEYKYTVTATDADGRPVTDGGEDTLGAAKALARGYLTDFAEATLVEVIDNASGDCVYDRRRES